MRTSSSRSGRSGSASVGWRWALGWAVLLTLIQIAGTLVCSGPRFWTEAGYLRLVNWDSGHFESIGMDGYHLPPGGKVVSDDIHFDRANVVFFPGYPLAMRALHELTGEPPKLCQLWIAHGAAAVAWFYFILLLGAEGLPKRWIYGALFAVAAYPASFFMITAYTESLFLAASLGFIYWCDRWYKTRGPLAWGLALLHGWVLSATRIVGFAVAAYPVFRDLARKRVRVFSLLLCGLSVLSSIAFFVYCQLKFGDWAVYFRMEEIGWQNHRKYLAVLNPLTYIPHFFFEQTVDSFSRSSVTLGGILFAVWGWLELRLWRSSGTLPEKRLARAAVAFVMFYIAVTGKANSNLDSMIRYMLPVYALLVIDFAELNRIRGLAGQGPIFFSGPRAKWKLGLVAATGIGIQIWNMYRFTHGKWVA